MRARRAFTSRQARAFTLVELLVVIGIIGLLISILLPALNKAREQANAIKCGSNMRQIYAAMMMYVNDNKNFLPAVPALQCTTNSTTYPMGWWMQKTGLIDLTDGTMIPYLPPSLNSRLQIFNCPTDMSDGDVRLLNSSNNVGPRNFSFSFNACITWTGSGYDNSWTIPAPPAKPHSTVNLSKIRTPGIKLMICEEKWPNDTSCQIVGPKPTDTLDANDVPGDRHSGYANYCFCDGHIERETPADILANISYSGHVAIQQDWWHWFN